jgi:hypothetical protein
MRTKLETRNSRPETQNSRSIPGFDANFANYRELELLVLNSRQFAKFASKFSPASLRLHWSRYEP